MRSDSRQATGESNKNLQFPPVALTTNRVERLSNVHMVLGYDFDFAIYWLVYRLETASSEFFINYREYISHKCMQRIKDIARRINMPNI